MGFWKWLGTKLWNGFKGYMCFGGWATLAMIPHGYILSISNNEVFTPTLFLWFIPMTLTAAHNIYVDCYEEDTD